MTAIKKVTWNGQPEADFVVSIIGMRINRWWMIHRWLPLLLAMERVVRDLSARPELGFRGGKTWLGRTILLIQYWHSFEQLETYAPRTLSTSRPGRISIVESEMTALQGSFTKSIL